MALTALDHEQIRSLLASYCFAIDLGAAEEYCSLFTDDGVFQVAGLPEGHPFGKARSGAAELEELHRIFQAASGGKGRHLVVNVEITDGPDDTAASARCYLLTVVAGSPAALGASGSYADDLRKVDGVWRFARRHAVLDS